MTLETFPISVLSQKKHGLENKCDVAGAELPGKQFWEFYQSKGLLQRNFILFNVYINNVDAEYKIHLLNMPMMKS